MYLSFKLQNNTQVRHDINMEFIKKNQDPEKDWEIIERLGTVAFGELFKAKQMSTGHLAILRRIYITKKEDFEEYAAAINIINQFRHDNIVTLYESFCCRDTLFICQEFCAGGSVISIMEKLGRPLIESQIQCITKHILNALVFLHDTVTSAYCDLRASKVLLTIDGCVKLALVGMSGMSVKARQRQNTIVGQPYWMAPEVGSQSTAAEYYDVTMADIWSLGVTVIEFAQTAPPNFDMHPLRAVFAIQKSEAPKLDLPENWSPALSDFLTKCLQKVPKDRATASQLLQHSLFANVVNNAPIRELLNAANIETNSTESPQVKDNISKDPSNVSQETISDCNYSNAHVHEMPETLKVNQ